MEWVYYSSHGKDSLAGLHVAMDILHWPISHVVNSVAWATDTIPGSSPEMLDFKTRAEAEIKRRWGLETVTPKSTRAFESGFYAPVLHKDGTTTILGWPRLRGSWCIRYVKGFDKQRNGEIACIGIAADETHRLGQLSDYRRSPLAEAGWTEEMCYDWCKENGLLSPVYERSNRDGCWFCPKQPIAQLRLLWKSRPDLWALMLKWDADSPVRFKTGRRNKETGEIDPGKSVADYDLRFRLEDAGKVPTDRRFKWSMLDEYREED